MTLRLTLRTHHHADFSADDARTPVRAVVLDGRTTTPDVPPALARRVLAGGCVVIITTPVLLESAAEALAKAGFCQPRFLKTEDKAPRQPWGMGGDDTTYALMARHKKGPFVFNERYHTGRLNGQPNDPSPRHTGDLKGAQGAVARTDVWPEGEGARIAHTISEVLSIHTEPDDHALVAASLLEAIPGQPEALDVLYRTRPEKPALSDAAQQRRKDRDAKRAELAAHKDSH